VLTLETLAYLRTDAGERLLAEANAVLEESRDELRAQTRLRRDHPAPLVAAAIETAMLRRRAKKKFAGAHEMFFTRDGLEQASGEIVAAHAARRFAGYDRVADIGCGIGGDTLALARVTRVVAVDRDPLRLAIARANVEAHGLDGRIEFIQADALRAPLANAKVNAVWCDPGRREGQRRIFDVRRYVPPLPAVLALAVRTPALGIKVAPGIRDQDIPEDCEAEFVQERGELKQAVLWFGALATTSRRATLLPDDLSLDFHTVAPVPAAAPRAVLYEPEAAVIRAHLVEQLGEILGANRLDETTAFLSGDEPRQTPYATVYLIHEWMPFNLKSLQRRLRALDVGSVVVKKRASPLDPQELERALRLKGSGQCTLVLTRVLGRHTVLLCSRAFGVPTGSAVV
jgi:predicted O-methyltransferase YrrM